jgi:cell division protein FtsZ
MGYGQAVGERRAQAALKQAISSPLIADLSIKGAKSILVNITADGNLRMDEFIAVNEALASMAAADAVFFSGAALDESLSKSGLLKVTVLAAGLTQGAGESVTEGLPAEPMAAEPGLGSPLAAAPPVVKLPSGPPRPGRPTLLPPRPEAPAPQPVQTVAASPPARRPQTDRSSPTASQPRPVSAPSGPVDQARAGLERLGRQPQSVSRLAGQARTRGNLAFYSKYEENSSVDPVNGSPNLYDYDLPPFMKDPAS